MSANVKNAGERGYTPEQQMLANREASQTNLNSYIDGLKKVTN
jgi:hypothetical protein